MAEKSKAEILIETIKVAGFIIGGCWVFFQYLEHDRQMRDLESKIKQQDIIKNDQEIKLASKNDSIKTIELKYLNAIKQSEIKALELGNLNNNIKYKYLEIESQLNVKSKEIDNQLNEIKLKSTLNEKYKTLFKVDISRRGRLINDSIVYVIKPMLEIINLSVNELEISAVVFEIFTNNLSNVHLEEGDTKALVMLDVPPNIFFKSKSSVSLVWGEKKLAIGYSKWDKRGYDINVFEDSKDFLLHDDKSIIKEYIFDHLYSTNGLGTGIYNPEEKIKINPIYYVRANQAQILCITVNILFNKGLKNRRFYTDSFVQVLEDVEK